MSQGQISNKNTRIIITLSKELKEKSAIEANIQNRSLSNLCSFLLENYVNRDTKKYLGLTAEALLSNAFSERLRKIWDICDNTNDHDLYDRLADEALAIRAYTRENNISLPYEIEQRF